MANAEALANPQSTSASRNHRLARQLGLTLHDRVIKSPIAGALPRSVLAGDDFHFGTTKIFVPAKFEPIPSEIQWLMNWPKASCGFELFPKIKDKNFLMYLK